MDFYSIISLFGYSEESPEIKALLKQLQILSKPKMSIGDRVYKKKKLGIELNFVSRYNFENRYGMPKKIFTQSPEECFFQSVSFGDYAQNSVFDYELPMKLLFKDKPDTVIQKLGVKAKETGKTSYGAYMAFKIDRNEWVIGFNKNREMICLNVWLMNKQEQLLVEMKRLLKGQDAFITSNHKSELEALKSNLPTLRWRKRMKQGDNLFNETNVAAIESVLLIFWDDLFECIIKKKGASVYAAVKRLVLHINKLNNRFDGFIETTEREELVFFIQQSVNLTGFRTEKDFDITEALRTW